jgi:hypothetical protein
LRKFNLRAMKMLLETGGPGCPGRTHKSVRFGPEVLAGENTGMDLMTDGV